MEDREFRIYVSSQGNEPLAVYIAGEEELEREIAKAREAYPNDTLYVREVIESVVRVYKPDGEVTRFD